MRQSRVRDLWTGFADDEPFGIDSIADLEPRPLTVVQPSRLIAARPCL